MYIFIDTISKISTLILFKDKKIISQKQFDILWKEYDNFLDTLTSFLSENKVTFDHITWLSVINWPWWFTWTRIISLAINTISFIYKIPIDSFDYFFLLEKAWYSYPMIIKANRWEYLLKISWDSKPELTIISNLKKGKYSWIWNVLDFENYDIYVEYISDYGVFINNYSFNWKFERMEPYYIKKPNIS